MSNALKKGLYGTIMAGVLSTSQVVKSQDVHLDDTIQYTRGKVSSLIVPQKSPIFASIPKQSQSLSEPFISEYQNTLFPTTSKSIGIQNMSQALLGNIKYGGLDVIHPPFVDYGWFEEVYCAGTIKGFIGSAKNPLDRTKKENSYVNREGIDAWMLPDEFKKAELYYQLYNAMDYLDYQKVGERDIIKNEDEYKKTLIQIGNHFKNNGIPGSILFIYFNLSNYKFSVKEYNDKKIFSNPQTNLSINTHQAIYIGNSFMEFTAGEIKNINHGKQESFTQIDVVNFLAHFVQQRGGYKSALLNSTKTTIIKNMYDFYDMIEMEVNGEKIDIFTQLKKDPKNRTQIFPQDKIKLYGPILMDGFHDANNSNKYISQNNHTRTLFYFEFLTIGTYTPSELLIPNDNLIHFHGEKNHYDDIINQIHITQLYYLNKDENISLKLKEAILRYHFGLFEELKITQEEIELYNKVEDRKQEDFLKKALRNELIGYKTQKIENIITKLSASDKTIFYQEYQKQIQGLQLMGYIQNEGVLNPGTTNINAPIPYFDTSNIESLHVRYIQQKKEEVLSNNEIDLSKTYIELYFFPGDNFGKIYTQLEQKLSLYSQKYPIFSQLKNFDLLKKLKLIDIIIDKYSEDNTVDVTNGKVPSMHHIQIPFDVITGVLEKLLQESYIDEVELSQLDSVIISKIARSKQDFDMLAHILVHESYEKGVPIRKIFKEIGRYFGKTSSYGDFQLRLQNLKNKNNALVKLPNIEQLLTAISYLDDQKIQEIIQKRQLSYSENIQQDLEIVATIKEKIEYAHYLTQEQRLEIGQEVYELLRELFRFNDSRQINIVGKIIQTSLVLDKMHEHYYHLNGWLLHSGVSVDEILYNENLLKRYNKLLLIINNRAEKTTLIGVSENYILRILQSLGNDIHAEMYPKLKKDFKGQISYGQEVLKERFDFYIQEMKHSSGDEKIKNHLIKLVQDIMNSGFQAIEIYRFFENQDIKNFLAENGYDNYFFPTLEEFSDTGFRELFFDYAKQPKGMTPPKNHQETLKIVYGGFLGFLGFVLGRIFIKKFHKQKKAEN